MTICHSRTVNLPGCAARRTFWLRRSVARRSSADFIQPGATVVDVGINRITDPAEARGWDAPKSSRRRAKPWWETSTRST